NGVAVTGTPVRVTTQGDVAAVTNGLTRLISSDFKPLVSGTSVTFKSPWAVDVNGNPLLPASGDSYVVEPLNLNTRVDEATQVDTLNVDNSNSPANDSVHITENRISGLGMGGDTVVAGQGFPGGIGYSNLETVNVKLGSGNNQVTIDTTSSAATYVTT